MLVIMAGLPGTGKSTLAHELSRKVGGVVLDKDEIRATLFPPDLIEYSSQQDDFVVSLMLQAARYILKRDPQRTVIIDGRPFSRRDQLVQVTDFARDVPPWRLLECVCSKETALRRIELTAYRHPAANRTTELYEKLAAEFQPIPEPKTTIDTDEPLEKCLEEALAAISDEKKPEES
jgi:predicted kinase